MSTPIVLPSRVDLQASLALKDQINTAMPDVVVDAAEVEMLGAQGLQVLLAAAQHLRSASGSLMINAPSKALLDCLEDLGATLEMLTTEREDAA